MNKERENSSSIALAKKYKKCRECEKESKEEQGKGFAIEDRFDMCSPECERKFYIKDKECGECKKLLQIDIRELQSGKLECSSISDSYKSHWNSTFFCNEICKNIFVKKESIKEDEEYQIRKKERVHGRIRDLIPQKYKTLETDKTKILNENYDKSLFIWGGVGSGKTVFVTSMAKKYIRDDVNILWYSFPALIMKLQKAFNSGETDFNTGKKITPYGIAEKIALSEKILFLDDLGAEKITEFVKQIMYYIINEREQRELKTIITSNFSLADIDRQIDPRISSRIGGMCKVLKFSGKDRRIEG